jgi:hypothetical protein
VGGGRKWERRPAAVVIAFEGGSEKRGGGGREERWRSKHVLVLNAAICTYSFHSISLSYVSVLLLQPLSIQKSSTGTIQLASAGTPTATEVQKTVWTPTTHDFLEKIAEKFERQNICEKRHKKSKNRSLFV